MSARDQRIRRAYRRLARATLERAFMDTMEDAPMASDGGGKRAGRIERRERWADDARKFLMTEPASLFAEVAEVDLADVRKGLARLDDRPEPMPAHDAERENLSAFMRAM